MKKWIWIPILIVIILLFSCQKQKREESSETQTPPSKEIPALAQEIANKLQSAIMDLEQGNVAEGTTSLLDTVLLIKPQENFPTGFENKILSAREHFQNGNYTEGVSLVSQALLLIKPDLEEKEEIEKGKVSPIAEVVREKILLAQGEFKKGNADKAAVLILESLQLFAPRLD